MEENNFSDMTILVVEDEENAREFVAQSLSRRAKKVWTAANGVAGLQAFKAHQPDIVISDLMMPSMNGIEMVKLIREVEPMAQVILASAHNDTNSLLSAIDAGIDHYIIKPINMRKLFEVLARSARSVRQNRQVKKMQENIQIILDYQENMIVVTDGHQLKNVNQSFLRFFKVSTLEEFLIGRQCISDTFIRTNGYLYNSPEKNWLQIILDDPYLRYKVKIINPLSGGENIFLVKPNPYPGSEDLFIVSFTNISELEQERRQIEWQATHDQLTRIYNRLKFMQIFEEEHMRFKRYGSPYCLIMFDIDHFKRINDTYGHNCGDDVLKQIAKIVQANIRENDTFARWGGEEFMVLAPQTSLNQGMMLAEKLRAAIESHNFPEVQKVTSSFGVVEAKSLDTTTSLIARVDEVLYDSKKGGRNRVTCAH